MAIAAAQLSDDGPPADLRVFKREARLGIKSLCREIYAEDGDAIQVRNEKIAVANLVNIVGSTLAIANRKGFAAMSLRDLAGRAGLSLGGLYAYINSKDDLVRLIQRQGQRQVERVLGQYLSAVAEPRAQLAVGIRTHVYLSEALRSWFVFLYMEARHLAPGERRRAVAMEKATENLFADIIRAGIDDGSFRAVNPAIAAGMLKALLQDWYLKHGKHGERGMTMTDYAGEVMSVMRYYLADSRGAADFERTTG